MRYLIPVLFVLTACLGDNEIPEPDAGVPSCAPVDLVMRCGERPASVGVYPSLDHLGTPDLTPEDVSEIRYYTDRLTAWAACAIAQ